MPIMGLHAIIVMPQLTVRLPMYDMHADGYNCVAAVQDIILL